MTQRTPSIRLHALRIANEITKFDLSQLQKTREKTKHKSVKSVTSDQLTIDPSKWAFVDLDPLLGNVQEVLLDDGSRACWPVDFAQCMPLDDFSLDWRILNARSMRLQDARKEGCRIFSTKMLALDSLDCVNGKYDWGVARMSLIGGKWVDSLKGPVSSRQNMLGFRNGSTATNSPIIGDIVTGSALRLRYEWSAIFNFPNGLNLRFGTTAKGALTLFKDREKEVNNKRRSPLLHWVSRHWRRGSVSEEDWKEIRNYLRGKEHIIWAGMPVTIVPAEYEMETRLVI